MENSLYIPKAWLHPHVCETVRAFSAGNDKSVIDSHSVNAGKSQTQNAAIQ